MSANTTAALARLAPWAALAVSALGGSCATLRTAMSNVDAASVDCLHCMPGAAVAAGVPIKVRVNWERCSSLDARCDPDEPPFKIDVACDAVRCEVVDVGAGYVEVTPLAPGTTRIVVRLADRKRREERLGPIEVVRATGIDLTCTFLRRGSELREPCAAGIAPGSDIHVEVAVRGGERRLAHPMPRDVSVDGKPVLVDGQAAPRASWQCRASSDSADAAVPEVRKCVHKNVPPGAAWTIEARLPAQQLSNTLRVKVAK